MPKLRRITSSKDDSLKGWMFRCPGCDTHHYFDSRWKFDGNEESPTFSPSLLIHGMEGVTRCHLFVRGGKIQFLGDCGHKLAGKTVEMDGSDW